MIDTHCHLYIEEFEDDINHVIEKAKNEGVQEFWFPAIDSSYHLKMNELKQKFSNEIHLMMGLHPCYVKPETFEKELEIVEQKLKSNEYFAIGEIGIDLYWDKSTLDIQQLAFKHQIKLAKEQKLPIVIHSRESFNEVFNTLEQEKSEDLFGIFHCFSGDAHQAKKAIELDFLLGIGGVVTFKNGKIDQFLNEIPLDKIVLETDSPYLSPTPFRGKRNEPSYLKYITKKLSEIYQVSEQEIIHQTTLNCKRIKK